MPAPDPERLQQNASELYEAVQRLLEEFGERESIPYHDDAVVAVEAVMELIRAA